MIPRANPPSRAISRLTAPAPSAFFHAKLTGMAAAVVTKFSFGRGDESFRFNRTTFACRSSVITAFSSLAMVFSTAPVLISAVPAVTVTSMPLSPVLDSFTSPLSSETTASFDLMVTCPASPVAPAARLAVIDPWEKSMLMPPPALASRIRLFSSRLMLVPSARLTIASERSAVLIVSLL